MFHKNKLQKISFIVVGFAAIAVVAVFASVRSGLDLQQDAMGKNAEYIAETPKTWDVAFASSFGKDAPEPFANATSIPTTFFISPDGKIKFAAVGLVPLADAKVIMNIEQ